MMHDFSLSPTAHTATRAPRFDVEHSVASALALIRPNAFSYTPLFQSAVSQPSLEQAWFWTEEWQAKEREADADIDSGNYEEFDTLESFISGLEDLMNN